MIEINELRVVKNGETICHVPKLRIAHGERVSILGANGTGKTTLLRVLAGLETTFQGQCSVGVPRRDRVYVHQSPYVFRGTVFFNAAYGMRARGATRVECEQLALDWLERLGVLHLAKHPVTHLSGGEKRRVALARAMMLRPRLLLLDEPLADMDQDGARAVSAACHELQQTTILIASPTIPTNNLTAREYQLQTVARE